MPFFLWSKTAASNNSADSTINWAEGQAPSSVNDSARAMMARIAEYRDDVAGGLLTTGSSTAYAVTTNEVFDTLAHMDKQTISIIMHTTSGDNPTLNVDGLGAKAINAPIGTAIPNGTLVQNTPYSFVYSNSNNCWVLRNFIGNPYNIPIGGVMPYLGSSAPNSNFVLPSGQAISRTTYATLFSLVSTTFGTGDGSTTFNVPDLRGRAIFGLDNMGGSAASRITVAGGNFDGTVIGGTGGSQNHTLTTPEIPSHTHTVTDPGHTHTTNYTTNTVANTAGIGTPTAVFGASGGNLGPVTVNSNTTGITNQNTGGGGAHTILPPAMMLPFILRVI